MSFLFLDVSVLKHFMTFIARRPNQRPSNLNFDVIVQKKSTKEVKVTCFYVLHISASFMKLFIQLTLLYNSIHILIIVK